MADHRIEGNLEVTGDIKFNIQNNESYWDLVQKINELYTQNFQRVEISELNTDYFKLYKTGASSQTATFDIESKIYLSKQGYFVNLRGIVAPQWGAEIPAGYTVDEHDKNCIFKWSENTNISNVVPPAPIYQICQGSSNAIWLLRVDSVGVYCLRYHQSNSPNFMNLKNDKSEIWLPFNVTWTVVDN